MISLAARSIDELNCGKTLSAAAHNFHRDGRDRQVPAGRLDLLRVPLSQLFERRDVREVVLGDVRNGRPGRAQVFSGFATDRAHRLTIDRAPAREVGQRFGDARDGSARRHRRHQLLRVGFHIVDGDSTARTAARHLADVDAQFARHAPHRRGRRRHWKIRFGSFGGLAGRRG